VSLLAQGHLEKFGRVESASSDFTDRRRIDHHESVARRLPVRPCERVPERGRSNLANVDVGVANEESAQVVGVGSEDHGWRAIADCLGSDECINAIVRPGVEPQAAGAPRCLLVGRCHDTFGSRQDAEYAVDLGVARAVTRRALDEDRRRDPDAVRESDDPAQV
jgi:hypothetical protein